MINAIKGLYLEMGLLGVLMTFSQSYIKHDLRKNKIIIPFFFFFFFFANSLIFMN
jgi:hypothetical protein